MNTNAKATFRNPSSYFGHLVKVTLVFMITLTSACTTNLQSKVAGNLNLFSKQHSVAILPVEILEKDQKETAKMLRQGLYAHLKESKFNIIERYVVDGLLKQHKLNDPADFLRVNPMLFAEILGADAVLISRINRVERSYLIVHSSIEIGISAQLVDTRTGEILWRAEQTEQDYQGIAKIPTGISSAVIGPIKFVTNKLNLRRMTSKLVDKLTAIVKNPGDAKKKETFKKPLIASTTTRDLEKIKSINKLETEWVKDSAAYTEIPFNKAQKNLQKEPTKKKMSPMTKKILPNNISWTPRKNTNSQPLISKSPKQTSSRSNISIPTSVVSSKRVTRRELPKYTVQVGAYKTEEKAKQMADNLLEKGYQAHIKSYIKNGSPLFKVHVNKFRSKKEARDLAEKFSSKENIPSFVTASSAN